MLWNHLWCKYNGTKCFSYPVLTLNNSAWATFPRVEERYFFVTNVICTPCIAWAHIKLFILQNAQLKIAEFTIHSSQFIATAQTSQSLVCSALCTHTALCSWQCAMHIVHAQLMIPDAARPICCLSSSWNGTSTNIVTTDIGMNNIHWILSLITILSKGISCQALIL